MGAIQKETFAYVFFLFFFYREWFSEIIGRGLHLLLQPDFRGWDEIKQKTKFGGTGIKASLEKSKLS